MSTSTWRELTFDGLVSCPGGVTDSNSLSATGTEDKRLPYELVGSGKDSAYSALNDEEVWTTKLYERWIDRLRSELSSKLVWAIKCIESTKVDKSRKHPFSSTFWRVQVDKSVQELAVKRKWEFELSSKF